MSVLDHNLLAWMAQSTLLAAAGSALPVLLRLHHPRTQLVYCHLLLCACLLLPAFEPWAHPRVILPAAAAQESPAEGETSTAAPAARSTSAQPRHTALPAVSAPLRSTAPAAFWAVWAGGRALPWILGAGVLARLGWLAAGLWRIRRYRIAATPLYPIPESVRAAASVTHSGALCCISREIPGPVTLGWLAPVVLLPESWLALDEESQCAIACHELLHVRRADWVVTLLEEVAGGILWFNPAAWMLLAQTRLAREQLVDAQTVRMTSAPEPYIEALLAIARGRQTLDLAPAPLFLRRRHLTHRMHALLKEARVSTARLVSSYGSILAALAFTGWFAGAAFPLAGKPEIVPSPAIPPRTGIAQLAPRPAQPSVPPAPERQTIVAFQIPQRAANEPVAPARDVPSAPVPADPIEPVMGPLETASGPDARATVLALLERARENGLAHRAGSAPYRLEADFIASGAGVSAGAGQLTETWLSGQQWRWTANLGNYSVVRVPHAGTASDPGAMPMSVHVLRNAIFWAARFFPSRFQVRTAAIQWKGKPATCILVSGIVAPREATRLWEEEEYCIDPSSGTLQLHSIAPGMYTAYGYEKNLRFHGLSAPDRITIYVNGTKTLDAQISLTDAGTVDPALLAPTAEMLAAGPVFNLETYARFPMNVPSSSASGVVKPVMVHASVDAAGKVVEEELLAASDPALAQPALDLVRNAAFAATGSQRQMYINVRYIPAQ